MLAAYLSTGVGPAKLMAAGNAVWHGGGPDFIFNRLEVSGPQEPLHEFIGAASGPGLVDWRPECHGVYEQIYFGTMGAGPPGARSRRTSRPQAARIHHMNTSDRRRNWHS